MFIFIIVMFHKPKASKEQLSEESKEPGAVLYRTRSGSAGPMLEVRVSSSKRHVHPDIVCL